MTAPPEADLLPASVEPWLLSPVTSPDFSLPDQSGKLQALSALRGRPVLLILWNSRSTTCLSNLALFERNYSRWSEQGLKLVAINLDDVACDQPPEGKAVNLAPSRFSFPDLRGSNDVAAIYNILYRQLFDRHRDLKLPTSFLLDAKGNVVKVYQGTVDSTHVDYDFQHIPASNAEKLARALPFPRNGHTLDFGRNYLSLGSLFYQRGYLDQAGSSFQQALRDDPTSAEAQYGIGSVYLSQDKNTAAREMFKRCLKLAPSYPDTWPTPGMGLGHARQSNRGFDRMLSASLEAEPASSAISEQPRQRVSRAEAMGRRPGRVRTRARHSSR